MIHFLSLQWTLCSCWWQKVLHTAKYLRSRQRGRKEENFMNPSTQNSTVKAPQMANEDGGFSIRRFAFTFIIHKIVIIKREIQNFQRRTERNCAIFPALVTAIGVTPHLISVTPCRIPAEVVISRAGDIVIIRPFLTQIACLSCIWCSFVVPPSCAVVLAQFLTLNSIKMS